MNRPLALLSATALLLATPALTGPAVADSHTPGDGYTAPAPTKVDRAGTDQDEYCIPDPGLGDLYTVYLVNGQYVPPLKCHPTNGAAQVHITTEKNYGTWTFDYATDPGPAAAPDAFAVNLGPCLYDPVGETEAPRSATVSMTNTADAGGRYIRALKAGAYSGGDGSYGGNRNVTRLEDGASFTAELFEWEGEGDIDRYSGVRSGKDWTFVVDRSDLRDHADEPGARPYRVFEQDVFVPSCRMTRVKRGYARTRVTVTAHDYLGAPTDRKFRIRLLNKRGRTIYRQVVALTTGQTRKVTLNRSALPKRLLAKGIPHLIVEHWDAELTFSGGGIQPTNWGQDYYDDNTPVWKTGKG